MTGSLPRVLLVCEWFVKYTAGLARGLADLGCEVLLLTRDHDLEFGGEAGAMSAFVQATLGEQVEHLMIGGRVRDVSRISELVRLRALVHDWDPSIVHVQDSVVHDPRLTLVSGLPRQRLALTVHDPVPHPGDPSPSFRIRTARRALRNRAALIFVHASALAQELRAIGVRGPIRVIPHGFGDVDIRPFPELPSLLFFGRISPYKGLDTLMEAMPIVWRQQPEVRLTIAGEGNLERHPTLSDSRVKLRIQHVPEDDVSALFGESSCVVLPYHQASQSGVGSEAKRHGRPIVATKVGGLPDLVTPDCGEVVPPGDAQALASAILSVVRSPGTAEKMGRSGAAAAENAGWSSVAAETLKHYETYLR